MLATVHEPPPSLVTLTSPSDEFALPTATHSVVEGQATPSSPEIPLGRVNVLIVAVAPAGATATTPTHTILATVAAAARETGEDVAVLCAGVLGELALEAGIPPGVVNVISGPGSSIGSYLAGHQDVDKVAFTGETSTGRTIMQLASQTMKRGSTDSAGAIPTRCRCPPENSCG